MTRNDPRFLAAIDRFDAANAEDPSREALSYARRMTQWLERLEAAASEPLRLAARAQHIRRWEVPRSTYPMTRAGYHQWRTSLARFHAETAGQILREVGYDDPTVARVQALLRKERLNEDPETQALEDVACLVFLEHYFADFAAGHDEVKVLTILRKTWAKMSPRGRDAANALAPHLPAAAREMLRKALSAPS